MNSMFAAALNFNSDLSKWDVSRVTSMAWMFAAALKFNRDLSKWDVSRVTRMAWMFSGASAFNGDISTWDVSSVTNMFGMFHSATKFDRDLSKWDVSEVKNVKSMFQRATSFSQKLCGSWTHLSGKRDMFDNSDLSFFCKNMRITAAPPTPPWGTPTTWAILAGFIILFVLIAAVMIAGIVMICRANCKTLRETNTNQNGLGGDV